MPLMAKLANPLSHQASMEWGWVMDPMHLSMDPDEEKRQRLHRKLCPSLLNVLIQSPAIKYSAAAASVTHVHRSPTDYLNKASGPQERCQLPLSPLSSALCHLLQSLFEHRKHLVTSVAATSTSSSTELTGPS